jgi:hypothetical protein
MERSFTAEFGARESVVADEEAEAAIDLAATKYATTAWINRLP